MHVRTAGLVVPLAALFVAAACVGELGERGSEGGGGSEVTSSGSSSGSGGAASSSSGNGGSGTGSSSSSSGSSSSSSSGSSSSSSSGSSSSSSSSSTSSSSSSSSSSSTSSSSSSSSSGGSDPYEAARLACINRINELRATKGRAPYARWTSAESCSDSQVTADENGNTPHGNFGQCSESGQNECLGGGAGNIVNCLNQMWAEKDQPDCSGCDACADAYNPNCPNCDFYGSQNGQVCGHYVNLSANYFSEAACGFSSLGGWAVINFH